MEFNCTILDCSCLMYFFMLQRSVVRWRATLTGACRRQVYQDYNRKWMGQAVSPCVKNGNMYPCTWIHLHGNALLLPYPLLPKQNQILWETHTYTCIIVQTVVRAFLASDLNSSCQRRRKLFIHPAHLCSSADAVLVCSGERRCSRLTGWFAKTNKCIQYKYKKWASSKGWLAFSVAPPSPNMPVHVVGASDQDV